MRAIALPRPAAVAGLALPFPLLVFAVAAAVRIASFLVFYLGSLLTGHGGQVDPYDPVAIDHWAWYAAQHLARGDWVNLSSWNLEGSWQTGFTYFVALQYLLVGHHPEVPRLVNTLLAAFSAPAVYLTARATPLGEVVARRASWLTALWPLSIYWTGYDLLRDPATWFLLALAMLAIVTRSAVRFAILTAVSAAGLLYIRMYVGTALYVLLPAAAALQRNWRALAAGAAALAVLEVASVAGGYPAVWSLVPYRGNGVAVTQQPGTFASGSLADRAAHAANDPGQLGSTQIAGSGSDAVTTVGAARNPKIFAERVVVGSLVNVLGPRPALADVLNPTLDTGMYPGLVVWVLLIPFTALGLWRAVRLRDARLLALAGMCVGLWFGISFLFAGGGFRQREMAFPVTLIFTATGLQGPLPARWRWAYGGYLAIGVGALAVRELGVL